MTITLVIDAISDHNNGTTVSAVRFASELLRRGNTVRMLTCGDPEKSGLDPDTGFHMYYLPELKIPIATRLAHKQKALFAKPKRDTVEAAIQGTDIVHIYLPWLLGGAARRTAKRLGVPSIAAFHIQPENITYNIGLGWFPPAAHLVYYLFYFFFFRHFRHIHCPSKFIAAQLRSHDYKAWLHVISNGVHPDFCPRTENTPRTNDGLYHVLMIGRLSPEKRQDVLIRAVQKSKYKDKIQLHFAGLGPSEKKYRRMGKRLPHPPEYGFYTREKLIQLIHACDLYVHASDIEIEGISCMEAFCCGLVPVIADSKRSATRQFALSDDSLFKCGSPAALAQRIDAWLENPEHRANASETYAQYGKSYALEKSVRLMEEVYGAMAFRKKNEYYHGRVFRFLTRFFYTTVVIPALFLWTRFFMGVRIRGSYNLWGLKSAITVCNHVHTLDSALIGIASFPRKLIFPTLHKNLNSLLPGVLVQLLGGVPVPKDYTDIRPFFDEMEFQLMNGRIVHFFPEGDLNPYDTHIRQFKKGAFHLAARARVPIVPMTISFRQPKGLAKLFRKKPLMKLTVGKPIPPMSLDERKDEKIRSEMAQERMTAMNANKKAS